MMQRTANENAAADPRQAAVFSFVVLCIIVFRLFSILGGRRPSLFRSDMLLIFHMAMIFLWYSFYLSAVSLSRQRHDILDFGFFLLSFVTRFACDIGQSAKIWI